MSPGTPHTRPTRRLLAPALIAAAVACSVSTPVILPPPFGPSTPADPPRFFFPTGIAAAPSGHVLVNNANFDRQFDSGSMLSLSPAFVNAQYAGDPNKTVVTGPLDPAGVQGAVLVSSFTGPLGLDSGGTIAFTGSRGTNLVTGVQLDPASGALTCWPSGSTHYLTPTDCRPGLIDTNAAVNLEGPYGFVPGVAHLPGDPADHAVMFVSSLVPHVDQVISGILQTFGRVAALDLSAPGGILYTLQVSAPGASTVNGIGAGPVIYDEARRQLILGGCYQRYSANAAGEPATAKCGVALGGQNPIRFVDVDSGSDANVRVFDLVNSVQGNETTALVLSAKDASGTSPILYALARNPDVLIEIELPAVASGDPVVRRVTPLPLKPSGAIRLERPAAIPGSDLIAVAGSGNSTVSIYDAFQGQVVAQINIADTINAAADYPFALAQLPVKPADTTARFVASIFGSCQVAFFEVDYAQPSIARLR